MITGSSRHTSSWKLDREFITNGFETAGITEAFKNAQYLVTRRLLWEPKKWFRNARTTSGTTLMQETRWHRPLICATASSGWKESRDFQYYCLFLYFTCFRGPQFLIFGLLKIFIWDIFGTLHSLVMANRSHPSICERSSKKVINSICVLDTSKLKS